MLVSYLLATLGGMGEEHPLTWLPAPWDGLLGVVPALVLLGVLVWLAFRSPADGGDREG